MVVVIVCLFLALGLISAGISLMMTFVLAPLGLELMGMASKLMGVAERAMERTPVL
jgi:multisubunit Na+/H+ antiporter MnhG subunit